MGMGLRVTETSPKPISRNAKKEERNAKGNSWQTLKCSTRLSGKQKYEMLTLQFPASPHSATIGQPHLALWPHSVLTWPTQTRVRVSNLVEDRYLQRYIWQDGLSQQSFGSGDMVAECFEFFGVQLRTRACDSI